MKITQTDIAKKIGRTQQLVSAIINGTARAGWDTAKALGFATNTDPVLWLDGTPDERKAAIDEIKKDGGLK